MIFLGFFNADHYTTLWNSAITTGTCICKLKTMADYVFLVWLNVKSRDLPQADKKLLQLQAENDNYFHQNYTKDHFETQSH